MRTICKLLLPALALLGGCHDDSGIGSVPQTGGRALFNPDPVDPRLPFPTNLLFSGSVDGTINAPVPDDPGQAALANALNAIDGFSTVAPITTDFDASLDATSLLAPGSVRIYEVDAAPLAKGGAVLGIRRELAAGTDYLAGVSPAAPVARGVPAGGTLAITLLRPLQPKTTYLVALTDGIRFVDGSRPVADSTYSLLKQTTPFVDAQGNNLMSGLLGDAQAAALEPLRALVAQQESVLDAAGVSKSSIILSWTLTTQSIGEVLAQVRRLAPASPTVSVGPRVTNSPLGAAAIFCGALDVPYYLLAAQAANPFPALAGFWTGQGGTNLTQFNPVPVATSTETIAMLLSIPGGPAPASGWPVAIFQHGIMRSRADMVAVADALASAGFAGLAIDAPLHGQLPDEALYAPRLPPPCGTAERTFDIDFATGEVPGTPDGSVDPSGTHFINLASPLTTRDNVRQAAADLVTLTRAAGRIDLDGDGAADLDAGHVRFVGHSLGAIIGGTFLGVEPTIGAATLSTPAGGVSKVVDGSPSLGPFVADALGANGVVKGTRTYEDFLRVFQTVTDAADPINYAGRAAAGRGLLAMEVVGGNVSPPDQVVPNDVLNGEPPVVVPDTIPGLGGTEPYASAAGLPAVDGPVNGVDVRALLRFTAGHHSSFLTPRDASGEEDALSAAVNREMQTLMATFLATDGTSVAVSDASLLAPVSE
ncbi:MAG: hypothetical protein U9R74_07450 [Pseudomonadota bacterium]|nr:hypothetical protein [Pseudomonadota bacterium]